MPRDKGLRDLGPAATALDIRASMRRPMTFASLGLSPPLLQALAELGYDAPTPVQAAAIPAVLRGGDLWASAQTGSGKTAAFLLPLLERLSAAEPAPARAVRGLILVPTRELALQIGEAIERYGRHLALRSMVAVGGVDIAMQITTLGAGADIVVATPGRLLDLLTQGALSLAAVETLVLDEADRLLSLGFFEELTALLASLPPQRQCLLFSATFPPKVVSLAEQHLREPTRINVDAGATPSADLIAQRVIEVDAGRRTPLLLRLLETEGWRQALVFVASRMGANDVSRQLIRAGINAWPLHGELSQGARSETLADFKAGRSRVLVATDLAARGLDIAYLPAVVNYDLPRSPADYAHRIGRTGRAGESGVAVSFVSANNAPHFQLIERRYKLSLQREQLAGFEPRELAPPVRDVHGGIKGKRKSKKDKLREAAARKAPGSE
jgi:ATP-dependent RNA helicase RhlE